MPSADHGRSTFMHGWICSSYSSGNLVYVFSWSRRCVPSWPRRCAPRLGVTNRWMDKSRHRLMHAPLQWEGIIIYKNDLLWCARRTWQIVIENLQQQQYNK